MSKEEKIKDMADNTVSKIWYRAVTGRTFYALKYDDPNGLLDKENYPETFPIYVGSNGQQPELLSTVLEELNRYREFDALKKKESDTRIDNLSNRVGKLEEREYLRTKKKWWKLG